MGIDIVFMANPKRLGIDDPSYGCYPARSMMNYLPDELCPMMHLSWSERRACPRKLREYVELLRDYTRYNDPTWDLRHCREGVYAVRGFIRIAKKYVEHDVAAYISM